MDHSRNFQIGMNLVCKVLTTFGLNIFNPAYRPNWRTVCCTGIALFGNLNVFYTLYYYRNNFIMTLRCLCAAPEAFQGAVKLYTLKTYRRNIVVTIEFIRDVYRLNANGSNNRDKVLEECAQTLIYGAKIVIAILIFILTTVAMYPVYAILFQGKQELFFEIRIMGYEIRNLIDYIVYLAVQILETSLAFTGNNACDLVLCMLVLHISILVGIFKVGLDETEALIGTSDENVRASLQHCIVMHQDLINYISEINRIYSTTFFYQTSTASVSLAMNCFCIVKTKWLGAYGFAAFSLMKIFSFCIFGTIVEKMNDRTLRALTDFQWYRLPTDCQKMFYISLIRSNNYSKLMIAKIAPLNVATGAEIIKLIYTYLMVLLNIDEQTGK